MRLAALVERYQDRLRATYGPRLSSEQRSALNAITGCRTEQYGQIATQCGHCQGRATQYASCGHRSCPACLNHTTSQWLQRQTPKLVPGDYFMVTFTLPAQLRALAKQHPVVVYNALMHGAVGTLKTFAANDKHGGTHLGMTAVLHTHTRRLDYHPHVHILVPAGGLCRQRRYWVTRSGKYLFNSRNLAKVFRARLLDTLRQNRLALRPQTPKQWVVDCRRMGQGLSALKYLSRYLYRGVVAEDNLISDDGEQVCFQYRDSTTQQMKTRTLLGEDFLFLLLQHVLPKGFRRARDYGFLHGNAKATLQRVQWVLHIEVPPTEPPVRPSWRCRRCGHRMQILAVRRRRTSG